MHCFVIGVVYWLVKDAGICKPKNTKIIIFSITLAKYYRNMINWSKVCHCVDNTPVWIWINIYLKNTISKKTLLYSWPLHGVLCSFFSKMTLDGRSSYAAFFLSFFFLFSFIIPTWLLSPADVKIIKVFFYTNKTKPSGSHLFGSLGPFAVDNLLCWGGKYLWTPYEM